MWGYDRAEEPELLPFKSQEQHFDLFCMVLERGFALHTGHSERLIIDFKLSDAGARRYLPRVDPKEGVSFRVPEDCLVPSRLYLHYDPGSEADLPELAYYDADSNLFISYDAEQANLFDGNLHQVPELPVVKLSTLRGLHYIKDIACLQLFELDFDRLYSADPALAEQVRERLVRKLIRFVEFTRPWVSAEHAQQVAREYLDGHESRLASKKKAPVRQEDGDMPSGPGSRDPEGFLSWE